MDEERLTAIEINLAHQQDLLQQLDESLVRQQAQLDKLQSDLERIKDLVTAFIRTDPKDGEDPPPHY